MKSLLTIISFLALRIELSSQETCQFENASGRLDLSAVNATLESLTLPDNNSTIFYFHPCSNAHEIPHLVNTSAANTCLDSAGYSVRLLI